MPHERPAAADLVLLVCMAALILFPSFPLRDLWTRDEPRYMQVAREMADTGEYLVPHLSGELYPDKPPMFFWLAAGFYHLGFGYNAGRMVAALAVIGTVLVTYVLARRMMPHPGPVVSALVVLTTFVMLDTKPGVIDPLLTFFAAAALACGHAALMPDTRRRTLCWLGFYALAALGVLTKGPVGLIVPGLVLLGYGLVNRRRVRGGGWAHAAGAALFVAIVCAWLVPALIAGGKAYAQELGLDQTLKRVAKSTSHAQPFYYYLMWYPAAFFPWSLVFPLALFAAVRQWRRSGDDGARLIVLWFAVVFVFFSVISGKRLGYLMPVVPAVGLGIGWYAAHGLRGVLPWPRWHAWLAGITLGVFGVLGAVAAALFVALPAILEYAARKGTACPLGAGGIPSLWARLGGTLAGALLVGLAAYGIVAARRAKPLRALSCIVGCLLVVSLLFDLVIVPKVNLLKSPRPFCEDIKPHLAQADKVYLLGSDMSGAYYLYTGRVAIPVLLESDAVRAALGDKVRVAVIAASERMGAFPAVAWGRYPSPVQRRVGGRDMRLVLNWVPETGEFVPPQAGN